MGARGSQQDSFGFGDINDGAFLAHGGFVAVVCDGMGGMEHGDLASRTAVRTFLDAYLKKTPQESIPAALERSVREANERVLDLARTLGSAEGMGTTLVAAALLEPVGRDREMYFISVGDSGLFFVNEGKLQMVNRPHIFANLLEDAVSRGAISKEQALLHPEREALTSFIGLSVLEEIDRNLEPWPMGPGNTILLASDGLFKTLTVGQMLETLGGPPQRWAEALVARTLEQGYEHQDNVTVLAVTVEEKTKTRKLPLAATRFEKRVEKSAETAQPQKRWQRITAAVALGAFALAVAAGGEWWYRKHHDTHMTEKNSR